ncbi:hypothetical protein HQS1_63320 (plasmid) [Delftia lacustris]|jgi:hypothetical protein|nr:hypothetical protein HQS1_63320 [Delftia lacustris]DAY63728.1 MAG TPA: hypothetical protein [Caudoviricetes sp.]
MKRDLIKMPYLPPELSVDGTALCLMAIKLHGELRGVCPMAADHQERLMFVLRTLGRATSVAPSRPYRLTWWERITGRLKP